MPNSYKIIDTSLWPRRMHCKIFRDAVQPQYCITVELDVTHFREKVRQKGWSFTLAFIHSVASCANEMEEFRYRFLGEDIVLYDSIDTSFSYISEGDDLFKYINAPIKPSIEDYIENTRKIIEAQKEYFTGPPAPDTYIFSALPWLKYTHVSHTEFGQKDKANPMFDWGKYYERDNRIVMPFSIQVHHSFVDGIHVAKLVDRLQKYLDEI